MKKVFTIFAFVVALSLASTLTGNVYAFSDEYEPYYPHITAVTRSVDEIYQRVSGSTIELAPEVVQARKDMIQMYKDVGIDISLDMESWLMSYKLMVAFPQRWSKETPIPLGTSPDYSGAFSIDAPWNNKIPEDTPRVEIPEKAMARVMSLFVVKANVDSGGWGTGLSQIVSDSSDPLKTIVSKYYNADINKALIFRVRDDAGDYVNNNATGDQHVIFIDSEQNTSVQTWHTRLPGDNRGYDLKSGLQTQFDIRGHAASMEIRLDGIGAEGQGGINAANCISNAFTIKSSEISSTTEMINHAIGGATSCLVGGRVYPAFSTDVTLKMYSTDPETQEGARYAQNTGVVPYGGVVQLDPAIDLKAMYDGGKLSFHAYRILRCMQEYGWYNVDHTTGNSNCVYTSTYANDWINKDFKGFDVPYKDGKQGFDHVVDELKAFLNGDEFFGFTELPKWYVVPPVMKYADLDVNDDDVIDQTDYDLVAQHSGEAYTDANKQYDVNEDKELTPADIEIMYNYLNDMPMHTFTWYSASYVDNDETHGSILATGFSKKIDGVDQFRDGDLISFAAIPEPGYEFAGWTGDFAGEKHSVVKVTMNKDLTIGAKYKKLPEKKMVVKVSGPGHVEISDNGTTFVAPEVAYGVDTLLSIKAVPDEGYSFLGWAGDLTGFDNPANFRVTKDSEIIALFGEEAYVEQFKKDEWELKAGVDTAYKITEGSKIEFKDWDQPNMIVVNKNKDKKIDLTGDYSITATLKNTTTIGDTCLGKMVFNYKDDRNYYYIMIGGEGKMVFGKYFKGTKTELKIIEDDKVIVDDVRFIPAITFNVERKGSFITITGYKDGKRLDYCKVRDKSLSGGTIGFGTNHNGIFSAFDVSVSTTVVDEAKAKVQQWSPTGNNDPWVERLKGAVAVAVGTNKAYFNDDYKTIASDDSINPYFADDGDTVYVPVRAVTEKLGGKVVYDPATDSVVVSYGEHSGSFKAWTNGTQENNGTLYVPGDVLAKALGKQYYQYAKMIILSDTPNVYDPSEEPECLEFIEKTFGYKYHLNDYR